MYSCSGIASLFQEQVSRRSFMSHSVPPLIADPIFEKKVPLIAFMHTFYQKFFMQGDIFSCTMTPYLKKLVGTKSLNTKRCPAGLSPRIIPHVSPFVPKMFPPLMLLCCPHHVWIVPTSPEPLWETLGMG